MWHWILDHRSAFNDIGMIWLVPVLVVLVATRLFRGGYHRGEPAPIPVRTDKRGADKEKPRSAA